MTTFIFYVLILLTPASATDDGVPRRYAYLFNDAYTCTANLAALAPLAMARGLTLSLCLDLEVGDVEWAVGEAPDVRPPIPLPVPPIPAAQRRSGWEALR